LYYRAITTFAGIATTTLIRGNLGTGQTHWPIPEHMRQKGKPEEDPLRNTERNKETQGDKKERKIK
jgi:hypothetical protein